MACDYYKATTDRCRQQQLANLPYNEAQTEGAPDCTALLHTYHQCNQPIVGATRVDRRYHMTFLELSTIVRRNKLLIFLMRESVQKTPTTLLTGFLVLQAERWVPFSTS